MLLFLCFGIDLETVIKELLSVNMLYCICNSVGCIFIAGYSGDASIGYFRVLHEQQVYCSENLTSIAYMPLSTSGPKLANIYITIQYFFVHAYPTTTPLLNTILVVNASQ